MNSSRTGSRLRRPGKMSTMPPRTANSPCSSAGSSRVKPASTSSSPRSAGAISWPGRRSMDGAQAARSGALTRGSSAAADATTTRAVPLRARAARGRAPRSRRHAAPAAVRIDLMRGKRQHGPLGAPSRTVLRAPTGRSARRRRPARGRRRRHDVQHDAARAAHARRRDEQRLCGRRQARHCAAGTSMPLRATALSGRHGGSARSRWTRGSCNDNRQCSPRRLLGTSAFTARRLAVAQPRARLGLAGPAR